MVTNTATIQSVHTKLRELQAKHSELGDANRSFGMDTLALLFNTSYEAMSEILQKLAMLDIVTYYERTPNRRQTNGKTAVWMVSLN